MTKIAELYGLPTFRETNWQDIAGTQPCPFLGRRCLKNRKSEADQSIGTCTVIHGKRANPVMICPYRLLERSQIFTDCCHLLTLHEPGNELRIVPEVTLPGGSVDYFLVSVRNGKPKDFVGVELQTLDTTGTAWPERQRFLLEHGVRVRKKDAESESGFGMNWKMTAKTILMQLHHKIATFEHCGKRLVLAMQDCLLDYVRREFHFEAVSGQRNGDSMQFHAYELGRSEKGYRLDLKERISTDGERLAKCLGLQSDPRVELESILFQIESKLPGSILLTPSGAAAPIPVSQDLSEQAEEDD